MIRGSAELVNEHGRTLVGAGTHAVATPDLAPSLPYVDQLRRLGRLRPLGRSAAQRARRHLLRRATCQTELRYDSGAFDSYGSWDYLPSYGYVWYPRVGLGWRPYSQGRWSFGGHFGWFWVGIDPLVVGHAPLRPLGRQRRLLVLDSRSPLVARRG